MSLLSRHVNELISEEFVLGVSHGFSRDAGEELGGKKLEKAIQSTKIVIVTPSASKSFTGYMAIEQKIADASVGAAMKDLQFPARCQVKYRRALTTQKSVMDGREVSKDVEILVVTGIQYMSAVDLVDVKVPEKKAA